MAVPSVNKAIPLENPPETSIPAQEIGSTEEASIQATADQPNGVAAAQDMTKQTEEIGLEATPVSPQGATADPVGASAALPVPEESVPSAEAPISSSEPHIQEEAAPPEELQNQESAVAVEESASQEVMQISVKAEASGEEPAAEKNPDDPKPSASEDVSANTVDGKTSDAPETVEECQKNLCLDAAHEVLPGDVNIDLATQNENQDKKEPVILLSKAIQSKGTSKCEGPPLSTRHLSGWLKSRLSPLPNFLS